MKYELQHTDGAARAGLITTDHGQIHTPILCLWALWAV